MSNKIFKQFFAKDFKGIDGLASALEDDAGGFNRAVNLEMSVGNSLRGRVGCQNTGCAGTRVLDGVATTNMFSGNFWAIFPYTYTRTQDEYKIIYKTPAGVYPNQTPSLDTIKTTADGATVTKLIGVNHHFWVLDSMDILVTYVAGTYPFTWYSYVNGSNINFNMKANGVSFLDTSLGNGITTHTSIFTLLDTIGGTSQLNISRTTRDPSFPFALVDGDQTAVGAGPVAYGISYTITVDIGHNFQAGDIITFPITPYDAGLVIARTGTTITYVGNPVSLLDGDVLGYMNQTTAAYPISTASSVSSGNLAIGFPYWRFLPEGDKQFGSFVASAYSAWLAKSTNSFYVPPTYTNAASNLYIAASSLPSSGTSTSSNNLIRIDGAMPGRVGLPTPSMTVANAGAGALTGIYKYKMFFRRYDAQGNIWDGPVSPVVSITHAAASTTVTPVITTLAYSASTGWAVRSAYKNTNEAVAAGAFFLVDDSAGGAAFLQPGDLLCFTDNVAPKAGLTGITTLHTARITGYDGSAGNPSIRTSSTAAYTIQDNTPMSIGLTAVFLRTTAGGNQYYVLCEGPISPYTNYSFTDNVTDAVLSAGIKYLEVPLGKEHDAPPPCTLVCQHQGGLVVARGPTAPNTIAFSTADGIEYFPTASNSLDVPSAENGFITAIASDTNDRLAVFKERAYYDIAGDLDGRTFSVNIKNEGDFGIVSQASLRRIQGVLIGLSKNGYVIISDGVLEHLLYKNINPRLINQSYLFQFATAVNDSFNRQYICSIPVSSGIPISHVIDYSREQNLTFERTFASATLGADGGMAMIGDTLYHLSGTSPYLVFRRLVRFNGDSPSGNGDGDSFIDNTSAISYILESNPITFGEPALLKEPLKIRLWSLPNDYVQEGWVAHSTLIESGASSIASFIGSGSPLGTSSSVTFSTANDMFKDVLLKKGKVLFYLVRLITNTIRTAPFWTGYEIIFAQAYEKEDLIK